MKKRIGRIIASLAVVASPAGVAGTAVAPAASARSCKWVLVSYDPTTGAATWVCSTARA